MNSQSPEPWSFAARAAYFGDRVCAFCHHHNPAGARFCNECASPLQLKPCNRCDAVNDQAATNCHHCGAAFPVPLGRSPATSLYPAPRAAPPTAAEVPVAEAGTQRGFATSALRAYWRSVRPAQFLLTAGAALLIAGAYALHHIDAVTPEKRTEVASRPVSAPEFRAPAATPRMPMTTEPKAAEPETKAALQPPLPAADTEAPKPASALERPVPVPATKRASARQRTASGQTPAATLRLAQSRAATGVRAPGAGIRKTPRADPWHVMQVSLARCSGDLFARIVCDQRVRQRFCAGRWGKAPECASFTNEHGQ